MGRIEVGKTYTAYMQGRMITPITKQVSVVWIDDLDVYYRLGNETIVKQTSIERFKEIVKIK